MISVEGASVGRRSGRGRNKREFRNLAKCARWMLFWHGITLLGNTMDGDTTSDDKFPVAFCGRMRTVISGRNSGSISKSSSSGDLITSGAVTHIPSVEGNTMSSSTSRHRIRLALMLTSGESGRGYFLKMSRFYLPTLN